MVTLEDYGEYQTSWCPGCGNFAILKAVKRALVGRQLAPHEVLFVSGIGQAAKAPHYLNCNMFNGLHGRSLCVATGAKVANPNLTVIAESGDGCMYAEGGNHFLSALRRNVDLTLLVHNNQVYGLTKGQASPTSDEGFVTRAQPHGVTSYPFNAVAVAVAMQSSFVARGFSGLTDHLAGLIEEGIAHRGLAFIEILQPCPSFNRVNTFRWYKERSYLLPDTHDPTDWEAAMRLAAQWGARIPLGIIYRNDRTPFDERFATLSEGPLVGREVNREALAGIVQAYG